MQRVGALGGETVDDARKSVVESLDYPAVDKGVFSVTISLSLHLIQTLLFS